MAEKLKRGGGGGAATLLWPQNCIWRHQNQLICNQNQMTHSIINSNQSTDLQKPQTLKPMNIKFKINWKDRLKQPNKQEIWTDWIFARLWASKTIINEKTDWYKRWRTSVDVCFWIRRELSVYLIKFCFCKFIKQNLVLSIFTRK